MNERSGSYPKAWPRVHVRWGEVSEADMRLVAERLRNASFSAQDASNGLRNFGAAAERASETARKIQWPGNPEGGANG